MYPPMEDEDDIPGKIGDVIRIGKVASVDLAAGHAVVTSGDIETPPSPWLEYSGNFTTWTPPCEGEQVLLICPEGDIAGAIVVRGLFSDANPAKASDDNHYLHGKDGLIIKLTGAGIEIEAPGKVKITGDVAITGNLTATTISQGGAV